ncbi:putative non-specific serine/threonine protein kinase [Helianthus anomalus]
MFVPVIVSSTSPGHLRQGALIKYRGGPWCNKSYPWVPLLSKSLTFRVVVVIINESEASFTYDIEDNSIISCRFSINFRKEEGWNKKILKSWKILKNASKTQEEDMEQPIFSFSTIANATANFSLDNKLGEGGFGPVYKVNQLLYVNKCAKAL